MSRLSRELSVAPRTGVVLSVVAAVAAMTLLAAVAHHVPFLARVVLGFLMGILVLTYGLLVSYVYGDARRRGMRHVLWTLIAVFVPNALGLIAYFVLREPKLQPCGSCGATARRDFAFCPRCGAPLPRVCPDCHGPVELAWTHCAHCGRKLAGNDAAPPASAPDAPGDESPAREG
jgi:Double zinc ribbon